MKKYIIAIIIIILTFAGLTLALVLPETEEDDFNLTLSAENITLSVGESQKLVYDCSIKGVPVIKTVTNTKIAKIIDEYITAVKIGETTVTFEVKYKGERVEKTISVIVTEQSTPPVEDPGGQDPTPPDGPEDPPVEEPVILFEEENLVNCIVEDKVITIMTDMTGRFSVYLENNVATSILVVSLSEFVEVTKITTISGNNYKIKGTKSGEYQIKMSINGAEDIYFAVVVI